MIKKLSRLVIFFSFLFFMSITAYAASGTFTSTYSITSGTSAVGILTTRQLNMVNNRQIFDVTLTPRVSDGGAVSVGLERWNGLLWRPVGNRRTFDATRRSSRAFTSAQRGNYRFHMMIDAGGPVRRTSSGDIRVIWTDRN